MIVLNLRVSSHKTLDDANSGDSSTGVYSAPKRSIKKTSVKTTEDMTILAAPAPEKTVLTREQERYLKMYEKKHDDLFYGKKVKTKIYVVPSPDIPKKRKNKTVQKPIEETTELLEAKETRKKNIFSRFFDWIKRLFKKNRE